MTITANEARRIMKEVLNKYDIEPLKNSISDMIFACANKGYDKIYYEFEDHVPENAKSELCKWLNALGYEANMPVADKTKIRISWRR